jgi:hypothetical protein
MGSASSALLRPLKTDIIDSAISLLQEPTNTNPKEMAENTNSSRIVWGSPKICKKTALS